MFFIVLVLCSEAILERFFTVFGVPKIAFLPEGKNFIKLKTMLLPFYDLAFSCVV